MPITFSFFRACSPYTFTKPIYLFKRTEIMEWSIDEEILLRRLKEMIQINSVNPHFAGPGEREMAEHIGKELTAIGLDVRYQKINEERMNVIGILEGNGPSVIINGHMDTVGTDGMTIDPFSPLYSKGKVYGRGSLDMKGSLAAMITAAEAVKNADTAHGDLIFAFVVDEEYGSEGTEALVEEYTADGAIVCEPTDLATGIAHKGFAWIEVRVTGRAAHGSRPEEGIDAIIKAGKLLSAVERYEKKILSTRSHPLLGSPSIHASTIAGGTDLSIYPASCELMLERRIIPGEDREDVVRKMEMLFDDLSREDNKFQAESDLFFSRSPLQVTENEPIVKAVREAYTAIGEAGPELTGLSFWTDAGLLNDAGIPSVIVGPKGEGLHSAVEYVEFSSLSILTALIAETATSFGKYI
jgi:acetylornithine deacetylase